MGEPSIYFSEVNERQGVFSRRTFLMGGLAALGVVTLGGRLAHLQIVQGDRYKLMSADNQFNFKLVPPPRGLIVDRNGVALASNRPNFRVMVTKDQVDDVDATLDTISGIVPITPERRKVVLRDIAQGIRFNPVVVLDDLTWEQFSAVNVRLPHLPGVTADMGEMRVYPFGGAFAHVIGYVSRVADTDLKVPGAMNDPLMHHPGFRIGKQGVEKALDVDLRGKSGGKKVEVDARGRVVREDAKGDVKAIPGKEVVLSLDADIQNRALEVMGEESGAIVLMDCRTGDVLCMASTPSFDANRFVKGLSGAEYKALAEYERKPLLDKALSGTYPPGSTFKTMTAMAALQSGVNPEERVTCSGGWFFGGRTFHCWRKGGHGPQTMHDAIKNSCDVYFYQMALRIGPDVIAKTARAFGINQIFDIGIPGQKAGTLPDRAWKRKRFPKDPVWHPGESPSFGIGQGALAVNALQLAVMTARLANGRKALNPRLIKSIGGEPTPSGAEVPDLPFSHEHLEIVRGGMAAVANDVTGTAYKQSQLGLGEVKMAGKTGTAQVRSYDKVGSRKNTGWDWKFKDHNLFVAFAPYDDPRYAMSVIVQHGGMGGATAGAPRAREVMRVALLKDPEIRARIEKPMPMPAEPVTPDGDIEGAAPPPPTDAAGQASPMPMTVQETD